MVGVQINKQIILEATEKNKKIGVLRNSIKKGEGTIYGFLGELLAANYLNVELQNTYDYDLITMNNYKADVKTKIVNSPPQPNYFCTVADYNTRQNCDIYIFVRILSNMTAGWILGYMPKTEFYEQAVFNKKNEIDLTSNLNWTFKADCYNIEINKLCSIESL